MDFRVLGPVEVLEGGSRVDLGGRKQKTVLALLVASAGQPTSTDRLIQATYGEDASDGARHSVQTFISNLRGRLGNVIVSRGRGYELRTEGSTFDFIEFADEVDDARARLNEDPVGSGEKLRRALAMWRGHPFQDIDGGGVLDLEISRLNEMRMVALEARIEADLASGRHRELIGELRALTAEHPFRESIHGHYMLALYRSGRQADALRAYQRMRRNLADELGIEPTPELRQLEQQILEQAVALDSGEVASAAPQRVAAPTEVVPMTSGSQALDELAEESDSVEERLAPVVPLLALQAPDTLEDVDDPTHITIDLTDNAADEAPPRFRRRIGIRVLGLVGGLALASAIGAAIAINLSGDSEPTPDAAPATSVATATEETAAEQDPAEQEGTPTDPEETRTDPQESSPDLGPTQRVPVVPPDEPPGLAPLNLKRLGSIPMGDEPAVAFADENAGVWFYLKEDGLVRVDTAPLAQGDEVAVSDPIPVGLDPTFPLVLDDQIWVPAREGGKLTVVDMNTFQVIEEITNLGQILDTPLLVENALIGTRSVWVTSRADSILWEIDPVSFETRRIDLDGYPLTPVYLQGYLFIVSREGGILTRFDPANDARRTLDIRLDSHAPIAVNGHIWITDRSVGHITIVDPLQFREVKEIVIGGRLSAPVEVDGQVWVSTTTRTGEASEEVGSAAFVAVDAEHPWLKADPIPSEHETKYPVAHDDAFWAVSKAGYVLRIDSEGNIESWPFDGRPGVPISAHGYLWIPNEAEDSITIYD